MSELTAQMSLASGGWRLYVAELGETHWPTFYWRHSGALPTGAERRDALASLGYELAPDGSWSWTEYSVESGDDSTPVVLIAAALVRPCGEVPA
ncbi:DUF6303 family protein [Streptomyces sp. NPDC001941]|uniref:DUF6303 family protein n=1 Tax=Streptomyces sp. NPDC001941 TaxID=3154659 RepID=UPI00331F0027